MRSPEGLRDLSTGREVPPLVPPAVGSCCHPGTPPPRSLALRKRLMALALSRFHGRYERLVAPRKRALFDGLAGTVLEIGPGTGPNFAYYPPDIRWIGIEPNPFMRPHLRAAAARVGLSIDIHDGTADRIALDDESADTVVSTLVLCSVPDVSGALREIHRVLRPGGRFLFIEHVADSPGTWLRRTQRLLRPLVRALADGCHLDRDTSLAIERHGFAGVAYQRFRLPIPLVSPHIIGVATKRTAVGHTVCSSTVFSPSASG
jgi:SAM-dependent methyltransferase